jgi:hypothetical protein
MEQREELARLVVEGGSPIKAAAEQARVLRLERRTMRAIAAETGLGLTTVRRILIRQGMNRLKYLDPAPPARRYEKPAPGMLLHLDFKKLARIEKTGHRKTGDRRDHALRAGWEYMFVAIDDHSRVASSRRSCPTSDGRARWRSCRPRMKLIRIGCVARHRHGHGSVLSMLAQATACPPERGSFDQAGRVLPVYATPSLNTANSTPVTADATRARTKSGTK